MLAQPPAAHPPYPQTDAPLWPRLAAPQAGRLPFSFLMTSRHPEGKPSSGHSKKTSGRLPTVRADWPPRPLYLHTQPHPWLRGARLSLQGMSKRRPWRTGCQPGSQSRYLAKCREQQVHSDE